MKFLLLTVALVHCAFAGDDLESKVNFETEAAGNNDDSSSKGLDGLVYDATSESDHVGYDTLGDCPITLYSCEEFTCAKCGSVKSAGKTEGKGDDKVTTCTTCESTEWIDNRTGFKFDKSQPLVGAKEENSDDGLDGESTTVENAVTCNLVKNIIEGDKTANKIEIKKVEAPILSLVCQYLKHHDGKPVDEIAKPIRSVKMEKIVTDSWDAAFIAIDRPEDKSNADIDMTPMQEARQDRNPYLTKKEIFEIILAANYMDIKSLLHLGCAKIATLIKGKSPEEIKKILGDDGACDANGKNPKVLCEKCQDILKNGDVPPADCQDCHNIKRRRRRRLADLNKAFAKCN